MIKLSLLAILAIAIGGCTAVFVGRHEGEITGMTGRHLLGANKCTWGPGYWCKNITTSHECGSIDHCVTKSWNNMKLPKDSSKMCERCISDVTKIEKTVNSTVALDVFSAFVEQVCSEFVPAALCLKYLQPYFKEVQQAIVHHIEPHVVCHMIFFCNNEEGVQKTYTQALATSAHTNVLSLSPGPVLIGDSAAMYGGNKVVPLTCSDGQVFWCENMENAKKCNAVEHCKQVVWSHQKKSPKPEISDVQDSTASPVLPGVLSYQKLPLNSEECHQGQTFWCTNITTAASCNAVGHCIQAVWSHMKVDKDTDDVCTICKDMVKQARDQLLSNETQNDLKAVFEGSCNLIPVKIVRKGCDHLADEFIPELVEVLSSQMNPDIVCSVAGLCNNPQIDLLITHSTSASKTSKPNTDSTSDCKNCADFATLITKKFQNSSKKNVIDGMRAFCWQFSSLSDACLKIVDNLAEQWYKSLSIYFTSGMVIDKHLPFSIINMCHENNMCSNEETIAKTMPSISDISVELKHNSETGVVSHEEKSDLPCELCDQLVLHLKDILVANTTSTEFKQILEGICKQTGGFREECLNLVKDYYSAIYVFLTSELQPGVICREVGLCPKKKVIVFSNLDILEPIVPIAIEPVKKFPATSHVDEESSNEKDFTIKKTPTPVSPDVMIESATKSACTFCEYILHFVQEQIADQKNEQAIMSAMNKACHQMPGTFSEECEEFVKEYGPAFVALVIQQIDPSQVCTKLKVCSSAFGTPLSFDVKESEGTCPLCLLAVQSIDNQILNNRTEENIRHTLDNVCSHLSKHLSNDCKRFINTYYDDLIDMIVAETSPNEICVYLRLCLPPKRITADASSMTDAAIPVKDNQVCILCEFIMTNVDKLLADRKTEEEIKHAVHSVCRILPKNVRQECYDFVNRYSDLIIELLSQNMDPKAVCESLGLCNNHREAVAAKVGDCALCKDITSHLDDNKLDKVCYSVGQSEFDECNKFILKYGTKILIIVDTTPSYLICQKIQVCPKTNDGFVNLEISSTDRNVPQLFSDKQYMMSIPDQHQEPQQPRIVNIEDDEDFCKSVMGVVVCQSQLLIILVGALTGSLLVVLVIVAKAVKRNRFSRSQHVPYEQLYQPTTIPRDHESDAFTTRIIS